MSTINNGGPAFPIPLNEGQHYSGHGPCDGMTLRDYFAAKAMQAALAGAHLPGLPNREPDTMRAVSELADATYVIADAMMKARGGEQ